MAYVLLFIKHESFPINIIMMQTYLLLKLNYKTRLTAKLPIIIDLIDADATLPTDPNDTKNCYCLFLSITFLR